MLGFGDFGVLVGFGNFPDLGEPDDFSDLVGSGVLLGSSEVDGSGSSVGFVVLVGSVELGVGSGSGVSEASVLGLVDSLALPPLRA